MNPQVKELGDEQAEGTTFVETALKLGGKSDEEARKTGALDRADEQVEDLFAKKYQTSGSPAHAAVWDQEFPIANFESKYEAPSAETQKVMDSTIEIVKRRRDNGTLLDEKGKITDETISELGKAGYWGLLVDKKYGGQGTSFTAFARFLTRLSTIDPTVAGLASVHGCIGAVDPLRTFGTPEQKQEHLPKLASGERLSAFALTEPGAGSDLTALKTKAELVGDEYVVNGEKLFITNAICGRTVGLVCLINNKPAVLIADLPDQENESFQIVKYGLYALKHSYNNGLKFKNFKVPARNLLQPGRGDGLTIAYHGLNRGRVALIATAAGGMRLMLAHMLPWAQFRKTYGEAIEKRELVRRRVARLAGLIVGCDAMTDWCASLLDEGYRGEMECIVAKIFGSESQKEACIELYMKTHGGRAFLHGHPFGDNVHEFLAPCIYEGEGEILGLGFFKSLIKEHGKKFFEPIGKALAAANIREPNPLNPSHAMKLAPAAMPYLRWRVGQSLSRPARAKLPNMPPALKELAQFAADSLQKSRLEVDALMNKHQLKLADRQCSMAAASLRIQNMIVMLTTCLWAARQQDEVVQTAAVVLARDLKRTITGARVTDGEFRTMTELGKTVANGGFKAIAGVDVPEILMPYQN
ncbi:MAG: acyl-CoA dehydrogenase family protein [Planctomycetaceae bacterium]